MLTAGVTVAWIIFAEEVGVSQEFVERVNRYIYNLEEARRFEKNYLLYDADLDDALIHVEAAQRLFERARENATELIGATAATEMETNLSAYQGLLERLATEGRPGDEERHDVERDLRRTGAQALDDAATLLDRERLRMHTMIRTSKIAAFAGLVVVFLVLTLVSNGLARQILAPLGRFVQHTKRIAEGDYSPVAPARRFRDEFSTLALAINQMLAQIKDHEAQIARSARMAAVGTLTAGVAHELNNPLNNISITAEAILEAYDSYSKEEKVQMLEDIFTQVERASATVRNLLDYTRMDKPVFVQVAPREVIEKCLGLVANEARLNGVEVDLDLPRDLPPVRGNPRDLQQVFLNLFLNAIQAMPDGGRLDVTGRAVGPEMVRIDVIDNGSGIPEEHLGSIFDPFFTTKEVGFGTGLGLSVAYEIVDKHGGRFEVESQLGEGTTFSLFLPCSASGEDRSSVRSTAGES